MASSPTGIDRREALRRTLLLMGGLLSVPTLEAVAAACDGDSLHAATDAQSLSAAQRSTLAALVGEIIPGTDTPGAVELGVPAFVTLMLPFLGGTVRARVADGLDSLDALARRTHGAPLARCGAAARLALVETLDREALHRNAEASAGATLGARTDERGQPEAIPARAGAAASGWYRTVKELTLLGYYTSQVGATKELRYVQVPGRFDPCVPFAKIGRAWAV